MGHARYVQNRTKRPMMEQMKQPSAAETVDEVTGAHHEAPPRGECPVCHKGELITISMTVHGSLLGFTSCHACEAKWWERDGKLLPLTSVIDIVTEPSHLR